MNEREIADWEREIRHAKVMQEQRKSRREGWDSKNPPKVFFASARIVWDRGAFTVTNKDNNQ